MFSLRDKGGLSFENVRTSALPKREIQQETLIPNCCESAGLLLKCRQNRNKTEAKSGDFCSNRERTPFWHLSKALTVPKEQLKWDEKKMVVLMYFIGKAITTPFDTGFR